MHRMDLNPSHSLTLEEKRRDRQYIKITLQHVNCSIMFILVCQIKIHYSKNHVYHVGLVEGSLLNMTVVEHQYVLPFRNWVAEMGMFKL